MSTQTPQENLGSTPRLPRLLRVPEVAEMLGVTEKTVYRMVEVGELPHVRLGRSIRFQRPSIESWLDQQDERKAA